MADTTETEPDPYIEGYRAGYVAGYSEGTSDGRFQGYADAKHRAHRAADGDPDLEQRINAFVGEE